MPPIIKTVPFLSFLLIAACQSGNNSDSASNTQPTVEETEITIEEKVETEPVLITPTYVPFPDGYGYMQHLKELQHATNIGDTKVIREHAWSLWAGIMQPVDGLDWPIWFTWPNTKGAFAANKAQLAQAQNQESDISATLIALPLKQGESLRAKNKKNLKSAHAPAVDTPAPTYNVPLQVIQKYTDAICSGGPGVITVCDGKTFVNNGDIMIPTESLSMEAMKDIRDRKLYLKSTLDAAHAAGEHMISVTDKFIVTKHMYWPVKAKGITAIPVWKDNFPDSYTGYAGYEIWDTLVALEPDNTSSIGKTVDAEFLYNVLDHNGQKLMPTVKAKAVVQDINNFYYHKVTQADWDSFDEADKAIITAASLWANNKLFEVGDYLVSVAMHVNTKELDSWTLQSVWWSDTPNEGIYSTHRPTLPNAKGPWDHYLLTDAYAVPAVDGKVKKAVNPYIEGVIHPIATSCRNCHVRAGWPQSLSSYQNADCPDLLQDLTPASACLKNITLTDYLWIIPDRAQ